MFKLLPTLLSLALLLVLTSACNRDAVDSTQDKSGAFLAPASAPLSPAERNAQNEVMSKETPVITGTGEMPDEGNLHDHKMTAEELNAASKAGPGRTVGQLQARPAAGQTTAPEPPKTMSAPTTISKPALDYDRPVMTVSKTACYGNCRQFSLTLTNDRRLILDAGKNMDRKGKYSRALNAREYNELLVAMQAANPDGLAAVYPRNTKGIPADTQGTVLRYADLNGNERTVEVYYDAPEKLDAFLSTFEALVDKDGWIKMAE